MSRIVIDVRQSGTSTGRYHDKLIQNLHAVSSEHEIVLLAYPHRMEYLMSIAPNFKVVPTRYKEFGLGEQLGFMRQIRALRPDLVHFGMIQQPILYRGRVVTSMLDLTPLRFTNPAVHPLIYGVRRFVFGLVAKRVARRSKAILCISEYVKNDIVSYTNTDPAKITVTYTAADKISDPATAIGQLQDRQFIMYVGRPTPHKNLPRLIAAFRVLQAEHPKLHLVLAGKKDALYEKIEANVKKEGIRNIVFPGFVSDGELKWLYENTACYVLPSLSEGFGLPGLEAMAHGAPVASSNATCLPEVYGDAAAYFDPFDIKNIAVVVDKILTDSTYANKLRTLGKQRLSLFSWKKMAKQTFSVYESVLTNNKSANR